MKISLDNKEKKPLIEVKDELIFLQGYYHRRLEEIEAKLKIINKIKIT